MARKRKIPARKHHGVRDPLKQLEDREKKLKNVVNNPPERGNDQKVSFKFQQFKKLADITKSGKKLKRIHSGQEDKGSNDKRNKQQPANKFKNIKQFLDEPDEDYIKRVNRVTSASLKEAEYEAKYGVKVIRNPQTGEITIQKKPKNEIDELLKQKRNERLNRKGNKKGVHKKTTELMNSKEAKELAKRVIKETEEEMKKERTNENEYKKDIVKFGEIVHAPPNLSILPRKAAKNETVPRPGKKNNLLLNNILQKSPQITTKPTGKLKMKIKRKDLPAGTRSMLETEQNKIIELYRNLKKSKQLHQSTLAKI